MNMEGGMEASPSSSEPSMTMVTCSGEPYMMIGGGTWRGHVIPGAFFLLWGVWWGFHTSSRYLSSQRSGRLFSGRAWYPSSVRWASAVEPFLKTFGPPVGILIELYLDHDRYVNLFCPNGSFFATHIHNWQHSSSYPAFMVSGIVDFLGMAVKLPTGTEQVFLSLAFGIEGFLMTAHKKHEALDQAVHSLLGYTMLACCVAVLTGLQAPHNWLANMLRSLTTSMQGVWLIQIGQMMYTDSKAWVPGDSSAVMMVPVAYAMLLLLTAVGLLVLYMALYWLQQRQLQYSQLPEVQKDVSETPSEEGRHDSAAFEEFTLEDSANDMSDDSISEHSDSTEGRPTKPKKGREQLVAALNLLKPKTSFATKAPPKREHIV